MIKPTMLSPANIPIFHADELDGSPLVGGRLYTYLAGTSKDAVTYENENGTALNTNPIILDMRGECRLWLKDGVMYKLVLKDKHDNLVWEQDNITNVSFFADIESRDETIDVEKKIEGKSYLFNIQVSAALMARIREIEEKVKPRNFYNAVAYDAADNNADGRESLVDSDGNQIVFFDF